ncbi:MAG TPA: ribonuclease P protein component [Salinivirgaceae bacterium]|nr:ribonuclease P protein component [Salinivirgaceae bacterium]HQA76461.1 ribonuclease P protein component [Salinivirgaceae bacterium]
MKHNTLNKHERLKSRKAIECLLSDAQTFTLFPVRALFKVFPGDDTEPLKVCVSVSKRKFKRAVDRNRLKRQMRESWRVHKHELRQKLSENNFRMDVMLIYISNEKEEFTKINEKIEASIKRLIQLIPIGQLL